MDKVKKKRKKKSRKPQINSSLHFYIYSSSVSFVSKMLSGQLELTDYKNRKQDVKSVFLQMMPHNMYFKGLKLHLKGTLVFKSV